MSLINGSNFIFIHIYKCGGMSLRSELAKHIPVNEFHLSHSTAKELKKYFYDSQGYFYFNTAFKFTFIRNPFDWVVSLYEFIRNNITHENYDEIKDMDFEQFCQWNVDCINNKKLNTNGTFNTLTEFLYDDDGNLLVDFIGRLENYEQDLKKIFNRLNIPTESSTGNNFEHINKSKRESDYKSYYNDNSRIIVEQGFAQDFKNFNYQF